MSQRKMRKKNLLNSQEVKWTGGVDRIPNTQATYQPLCSKIRHGDMLH